MKYTVIIIFILIFFSSFASTQIIGQFQDEPTEDELGAPLFPESEFIRKSVGLDPYHETAIYISLIPMEMVESFFEKKLPEKRVVYYSDEDTYMTVFLLKTWSKFPGKPTKDELSRLESEPSIQILFYDPIAYEPLAEYFEKSPEGKIKAATIRNGKTMIKYTYEIIEEYKSSKKIISSWKEISRDLKDYYGSILEFKPDSTYTFSFTPENIVEITKVLTLSKEFKGKSEEDVKKYIEERNPEHGIYVLMKNNITMVSEKPLDGMGTKYGLVDVGSATLSLTLYNKPKLTFLKIQNK